MIQERILPVEIAAPESLNAIEKRYRRSRKKIWFGLAIPGLWITGGFAAYLIDELWAWEALVGWCLLTTFLVGVYMLYQVPSTSDAVHQYSHIVLPGLFKKLGAENVRVARRHDLPLKTLLVSGLYYGKYASLLREDSVTGFLNGNKFGMYEVAIQTTVNGIGTPGASADLKANEFYGWFIICDISPVAGFHFITMRKRVNSGEADDWHRKTCSHWENDGKFQKVRTGNSAFDSAFAVNSDQPHALMTFLAPSFQHFLLHIESTTKNSFAISIQRSEVYFMIGHEHADLRKSPAKNFTTELPVELVQNVRWYVELIRGLSRLRHA